MQFDFTPYLVPPLIAALVAFAMVAYLWRRRGATAIILLALAVGEWSLAYALEIAGADLFTKVLWGKLQYIGITTVPLSWLAFALTFAERRQWLTPRYIALTAVVPGLTLVLALTTELHSLIWTETRLDVTGPFLALIVTHGPAFWVYWVYSQVLVLAGTALIVITLLSTTRLYRRQAGALLVAALAPWIANLLYVSGLNPAPQLDLTPLAFAFSAVTIVWAVFQFRLIDLAPIARTAIVENLRDAIFVLDPQGRVADLNQAAARMIGRPASQIMGLFAQDVFQAWSEFVQRYQDVTEGQYEITLGDGSAQRYFELHITPLRQRGSQADGRVVRVSNITERKQAEARLFENEARYRQLVESASDIIYRADAQGRFTFVNATGMRVMGFKTEAEVVGRHYLELVRPDWRRRLKRVYDHQFLAGEDNTYQEFPALTAEGQTLWVGQNVQLLKSRDVIVGFQAVARDITARKDADAARLEAEEKYRTLVEQVPAVVYTDTLREVASALYTSPQTTPLLGYSPEDWLADPDLWAKLLHPDDGDRVIAANQKHNLTGEPFREEYRLRTRDGRMVWIRDEAVIIRDKAGQPQFSQGIFWDITDLKRAEEVLREAETKYRTLVEQIPAVVYIDSLSSSVIDRYISPQVTALLGYTPEEWLADPDIWSNRIHPEDRDRIQAIFQDQIRRQQPFREEYRLLTRDNRIVWVRDEAVALWSEAGQSLFYQGVLQNITDRKQTEQQLARRAVQLETFYQLSRDLGASLDLEAVCRVGHRSVEALMPVDAFYISLLDEERQEVQDVYLFDRGQIWPNERRPLSEQGLSGRVIQSGQPLWIKDDLAGRSSLDMGRVLFGTPEDTRSVMITPLRINEKINGVISAQHYAPEVYTPEHFELLQTLGNHVAVAVENIRLVASLRQQAVVLAQARDQALEANRLKSQLLARVSHELRTPLGAILGHAQLLEAGLYGTLAGPQPKVVADIIDSTHSLTALVDDLLDEVQLETRALHLQLAPFSPDAMLRKVERAMLVLARSKGLVFSSALDAGLPAQLMGDEPRLRQILINLLGNAIKFTPAGEVHVRLTCPDAGHWAIIVTDTGRGIPPEAHQAIFEPFRQVDGSLTRDYRGVGLGLSIVKHLVELMAGRITLESRVGRGSTFTILLPLLTVSEPTL